MREDATCNLDDKSLPCRSFFDPTVLTDGHEKAKKDTQGKDMQEAHKAKCILQVDVHLRVRTLAAGPFWVHAAVSPFPARLNQG